MSTHEYAGVVTPVTEKATQQAAAAAAYAGVVTPVAKPAAPLSTSVKVTVALGATALLGGIAYWVWGR